MADQTEMSAFYLRQLDFLRKFTAYFVEKAAPLIAAAERNKYQLPEAYRAVTTPSTEDARVTEILAQLKAQQSPREPLSPRERQCLQLLSQGLSATEVGDLLGLSRRTVENYVANVKSKWHCSKTSELIHAAMQMELLA